MLLFGTAFYNGNIRTFGDVEYEQVAEDGGKGDTDPLRSSTPVTMVSPSLMRY